MNQNIDFQSKLFAIQPFKQTVSPFSSDRKNVSEDAKEENDSEIPSFNVIDPANFLQDLPSLKKTQTEQIPLPDTEIGESNKKTMSSISSTIDILFSKIEKIKQQFSFALDKPCSESETVSDFKDKEQKLEIKSDEGGNKQNEDVPFKISHHKSKPVETTQYHELCKPLQLHNNNEIKLESKGWSYPPLNIFQPWAQQQKQGLQIRDFQLGRCIGSGKFGDVFMSQHKKTGFICAIKKILKSTIIQYNMVDQFATELRIHYSLDHPNVVKLYSHFEDEYHIFLLMELSANGSLIQSLSMEQEKTSKMVDQITDGLVYIHRKKIIHRDIKPENIVMNMGVPKLCDFGWAAINESIMHQTFCGTLDYVSPQMKDQGQYNESIDLWSIGVLTFQLIAGFPPFKQEITNWKIKGSKRKVKWNWQVLYPPQIGTDAKNFIEGLLQVDPILRSTLVQCKSSIFLQKYRSSESELNLSQLNDLFQ